MQARTWHSALLGALLLAGRSEAAEQTLLILRVDRELSWKDVAAVLSEPGEPLDDAAVRKRFQRLKTKLHRMAKREGLRALLAGSVPPSRGSGTKVQ